MYDYYYELLAMLVGLALVVLIIAIPIMILFIVCYWRIFKKAGEAGWKSLIPIYSHYTMAKVAKLPYLFWAGWILGIMDGVLFSMGFVMISWVFTAITAIVYLMIDINVGRRFGKGVGFIIGMILLPIIFWPILAFDSSQYQK